MLFESRVVWSEGMFLRAQHFQQADRWTEHLVRVAVEKLSPYPWGISEMCIDESCLTNSQFALSSLRGILPDGTSFNAPADTDLPAPILLDERAGNSVIYLALPLRQPGKAELAINQSADTVRFVASSYEVPDANIETDFSAPINVGRLKLRLLKTGDDLSGYTLLGLVRVSEVRSDKTVILDTSYIAPCLNCTAEPKLQSLVTELLGIVRHRSAAIAARLGTTTLRSTPNIGDYVLLHALNRADPLLAHITTNASRIHPIFFFEQCLQLAGELATFTTTSRQVSQFEPYRHDDLKTTFSSVFDILRASLSVVLQYSAIAIELELRTRGVRIGTIHDRTLLKESGFVLAIRAEMPGEDIRRKLPLQIKIGPVERIEQLVNVALSGIPVVPLPVAPRQLPYHTGTVYFELDTKHPLWAQLETSGAIALHLSGDFPNLEMELWGLRE